MRQRRWFLRLCVFTIVSTILIGALLMVSLQSASPESLQASLDGYKTKLTVIRLMIIGLIALIWPKLVQSTELSGAISIERSKDLKELRWRIIGWLLLIELLLGQNLIWRLLQTMGWSGA